MGKPYSADGDKEFWERHERSCQSKERKNSIKKDVLAMMNDLVESYSEEDYDPRKDVAWYFEQFGKDLRSDVDKEKSLARELKSRTG